MINTVMRMAHDLEMLVWYIPHLTYCIDMESRLRMAKPDFNLIDYRLNDAELEAFEKWSKGKIPTTVEVFSELAIMSYKISFTHVASSEAWCVSITGTKDAKFNSGATLTTWSDDCMEAMYMAFFKVTQVFEKGVWKTKTQSRRG
jgi:hypothetical protein